MLLLLSVCQRDTHSVLYILSSTPYTDCASMNLNVLEVAAASHTWVGKTA
jgi:hypothetical protein